MVGGGVSEIAIHELNLKSLLCRKRRTIIRKVLLFRNVYTSDVDPAETEGGCVSCDVLGC